MVDDAGVQRQPGLQLSSVVSVPALNIPSSRVDVLVGSGNGTVNRNITVSWTSTITPVSYVTLYGVVLTISQGVTVSGCWLSQGLRCVLVAFQGCCLHTHPLMCLCVFWLCLALFVTDLECFRLSGGCAGQCADDSPQQHKRHQAVTQSVCFGRCRSERGVGWVHTTQWLHVACAPVFSLEQMRES